MYNATRSLKVAKAAIWAICLFPIWGSLLCELWEGSIRPLLVSRNEIDALSAAMLARHADRAEQMAFIEEDRAWRYSDSFEQGKCRRVRKTIERLRHDARASPEQG
jgi:hypothetical protein